MSISTTLVGYSSICHACLLAASRLHVLSAALHIPRASAPGLSCGTGLYIKRRFPWGHERRVYIL